MIINNYEYDLITIIIPVKFAPTKSVSCQFKDSVAISALETILMHGLLM